MHDGKKEEPLRNICTGEQMGQVKEYIDVSFYRDGKFDQLLPNFRRKQIVFVTQKDPTADMTSRADEGENEERSYQK